MTNRNLSISELGELIRVQKESPVELVKETLKRIERLNPVLNAFITVTPNRALEKAKLAEEEIGSQWKGPLHGIPVAVKDFYDTADIRTTAAFALFRDRVPAKDAEAVRRLREAGAILVGKTNMHELGMGTTSIISHFGSVHNPWNTDYIAGGSSGGSAAAVAAGMCYATLDTDAIGSCRLPAACCGVTGFKATYGLVSTKGILEGEKADENIIRIAHAAFTCRTADDAAILLNALADKGLNQDGSKTSHQSAPGKNKTRRIGIVQNFNGTAEVRKALSDALEILRSFAQTSDVNAPLSPSFGDAAMEEDRKTISKTLFRDVDVLVLPTTTEATPTIDQARTRGPTALSADNTFFCNYYGLPAISVPCGFSKNGLPLGLQIVGPKHGEAKVLDTAHVFQQATKWHLKHPALAG